MKFKNRAEIHAFLDVMLDQAEGDLTRQGFGMSMLSGGGPEFSIMLLTGRHRDFTPKQLSRQATLHISEVVACARKLPSLNTEEVEAEMAKHLAPKQPGVN